MKLLRLVPALALAALLPSCAPVFSEMQSAKLVGKGNVELTPSASAVLSSGGGETEHVQDHLGLQVATGVADKVDVRARYEHVRVEGGDGGVHVLGGGPKIALVKDKVAVYVPVGFAFGEDIEAGDTLQVQPTLLLTAPISSRFELNGSAKYIHPFDADSDDLVALNVGVGLSADLERWAVRPEVGILKNPGEEGSFLQFSLGVSIRP
jgi:hypothetical protein